MALTIQNVVDWARTHAKLIPIVGVGGFSNEPALSIANDVIQEILSPPFNWKFNRKEATTFDTVENQQDYTAAITDLGWLESCSIVDKNSTLTPQPQYPIEVVQNLPPTYLKDDPMKIAWMKPTGSQITFRLDKVASTTIFTVKPVYQGKPPIKTSLTQDWSPIPDEMGFVIRQGFLAHAYRLADDPRAAQEYAKFIAMIKTALGYADAEQEADSFHPSTPIMIG